jgi:hypothetical protein
MRPLSEPAAGSITALIRVGLPESMASFTARFSSSGEVGIVHYLAKLAYQIPDRQVTFRY